jgi:hypothetical protein
MKTCGNCHYANTDYAEAGYGFCTNAKSWFAHKLMPATEGCTQWTEPDEEPREQADGYSSFDGCREGASWPAERDRRLKGETGGHW